MSAVIARKKADGTEAFSCQISIMRDGAIVHRESRTFSNRAMAKAWGERRERDLARPGGLEAAKIGKETLADAIDKYVATSRKKIGRTKAKVLESIKGWTSPTSDVLDAWLARCWRMLKPGGRLLLHSPGSLDHCRRTKDS